MKREILPLIQHALQGVYSTQAQIYHGPLRFHFNWFIWSRNVPK